MTDAPDLPPHIEQTIEAIAELHREHHRRATPSQKAVTHLTAFAGRPRFVGALTVILVLWVSLNGFAKLGGLEPPDPPPFSYLQGVVGVAGIYVVLLILITQRHENQLADIREQLTLELAILNEQRSAKTVFLLEELRRDLPSLPNRRDDEAEQLAQATDPHTVVEALRSSADVGEAPPSEDDNA
jgi:uncharacterized membrane protein